MLLQSVCEGNIRYEHGAFSKWKKLSRLLVKAAFISCFPLNAKIHNIHVQILQTDINTFSCFDKRSKHFAFDDHKY